MVAIIFHRLYIFSKGFQYYTNINSNTTIGETIIGVRKSDIITEIFSNITISLLINISLILKAQC